MVARYRPWVGMAVLVGVGYLVIGRVFAIPITHVRVWRLAAWVFSGAAFAAHIGYEHYTLRDSPWVVARHAALAVAIGGFTLAVAGMLHSLSSASWNLSSWLLALILWPAATAMPAFVAAFVAAAVLTRIPRRSTSS